MDPLDQWQKTMIGPNEIDFETDTGWEDCPNAVTKITIIFLSICLSACLSPDSHICLFSCLFPCSHLKVLSTYSRIGQRCLAPVEPIGSSEIDFETGSGRVEKRRIIVLSLSLFKSIESYIPIYLSLSLILTRARFINYFMWSRLGPMEPMLKQQLWYNFVQ